MRQLEAGCQKGNTYDDDADVGECDGENDADDDDDDDEGDEDIIQW